MDERTRSSDRNILVNQILRSNPGLDRSIAEAFVARTGTVHEQNEAFGREGNRYYPIQVSPGTWEIGGTIIGNDSDPVVRRRVQELNQTGISTNEAIDLAQPELAASAEPAPEPEPQPAPTNQRGAPATNPRAANIQRAQQRAQERAVELATPRVEEGPNGEPVLVPAARPETIEREVRNILDVPGFVVPEPDGPLNVPGFAVPESNGPLNVPGFAVPDNTVPDIVGNTQSSQAEEFVNSTPNRADEFSSINLPPALNGTSGAPTPGVVQQQPNASTGVDTTASPATVQNNEQLRIDAQRQAIEALQVDATQEIAVERGRLVEGALRGRERALQAAEQGRLSIAQRQLDGTTPGNAFTNLDSLSNPSSINTASNVTGTLAQVRGLGNGVSVPDVDDLFRLDRIQNRVDDELRAFDEVVASPNDLELAARKEALRKINIDRQLVGLLPQSLDDLLDAETRFGSFQENRSRAQISSIIPDAEQALKDIDDSTVDLTQSQETTRVLSEQADALQLRVPELIRSFQNIQNSNDSIFSVEILNGVRRRAEDDR